MQQQATCSATFADRSIPVGFGTPSAKDQFAGVLNHDDLATSKTRTAVREAAWLAISATLTLSLRRKRVNRTSRARFPARRRMHEQGRRTSASYKEAPLFPGRDRQIAPVQAPSTYHRPP